MIPGAAGWAWLAFLLVSSFAGVSILLLALLLVVALARARARGVREAASAAARPVLHKAVVEYLAGSSAVDVIRRYLAKQRGDVVDALTLFQSTVGGSARDRLCSLALDFGIVHQWCTEGESQNVVRRRDALTRLAYVCSYEPVRRVADEVLLRATKDLDEEVRLAAARGLLQAGEKRAVASVFDLAIGPNLLTRVVLAEDLRRHAMEICADLVPAVLRSENAARIRGVLELLVAWERAIPLDDVRDFLEHRERPIRLLAFRLVLLVPANFITRLALIRALNESDQEIRTLAVIAAGRLKLTDATAELARCMREGDLDLARHAAEALAAIPRGLEALEKLSSSDDPQTARTASEALARARSNP